MAKLIKKLAAFIKLPQKTKSLNSKIKKEIQKMIQKTGPDEFLKGSKWEWIEKETCYCVALPNEQYEKYLLPILRKHELVIGDDESWLYMEYWADEDKIVYILDLGYDSYPITNVMTNPKLNAKAKELAFAERRNA